MKKPKPKKLPALKPIYKVTVAFLVDCDEYADVRNRLDVGELVRTMFVNLADLPTDYTINITRK